MSGVAPTWRLHLATGEKYRILRYLVIRPSVQGWEIGLFGLAPATLDGATDRAPMQRVAGACLDLPREVGVNDVALDPERLTSLLCGRDDPFWAKVK